MKKLEKVPQSVIIINVARIISKKRVIYLNRPKLLSGRRTMAVRILIYLVGIIILSFGITLNTKTGLGVSPIISIPFNISTLMEINLGTMTFIFYSLLVLLQILLLGRNFKIYQLLQLVMSLITSLFIDFFDQILPQAQNLPLKILLLAAAIIFTGLGASLTVGMKIVPNPADGFADVLGQKLKQGFGFGKNVFDLSCILLSLIIGFIFSGRIIGIGIGTIISMILTGRVVAFCQSKLMKYYQRLTI